MHIKRRYKYFPQMEHYDALDITHTPYLMFKTQGNYCSSVVNTDSNGFRFSGEDGKLELDNLNQTGNVNIFTGGSTAFGVGATSDKSTIPAYLSKATNSKWVNFSGRAYTSTQEFISFAYYRHYLPSVDNIVIFSGVNDLYLYFVSKYFNKQMGSFFNANSWMYKMGRSSSLASLTSRPILNKMLSLIYGVHDFNSVSDRDALNLLFRKISIGQIESKLSNFGYIDKHNQNPSEVIDVLRRNISNWKIMADSYNAKIIYVLQPLDNWLPDRLPTENEKNVFDIMDKSGGKNWQQLSEPINDLHEWYSKELSRVCEELNINYYDSNIIMNKNFKEDMFVDRIHLTDYSNIIVSDFIVEKIWK